MYELVRGHTLGTRLRLNSQQIGELIAIQLITRDSQINSYSCEYVPTYVAYRDFLVVQYEYANQRPLSVEIHVRTRNERTDTDLPGPPARARAKPGPATPRACLIRSVTYIQTSMHTKQIDTI